MLIVASEVITLTCVSDDSIMLRKHGERGESSSKTTILIRDMGREFIKNNNIDFR